MSTLPHVVFDVGNVLIRWDPTQILKPVMAEADIAPFLAEIGHGPWNLEQDRGRTWDEAVAVKTAEFPEHADLIRRFHDNWHDAVPGPITETVEVLEALHAQGRPIYGITNFSTEKWVECQTRFPFLTLFTDVVVSAHERLVKPDPRIFEFFLLRNGLQAQDCLFIDDSAANVASAESLGFDTILFDDPACVLGRLRIRGLPV